MSKNNTFKYLSKVALIITASCLSLFSPIVLNTNFKAGAAVPYENIRANLDSTGAQANSGTTSSSNVSVSDDGRFVTFSSGASNLVSGDTNGKNDVFLKDLETGSIQRVNIKTTGTQTTTQDTGYSKVNSDGKFVAFYTSESDMTPGDGSTRDVFLRDIDNGTTEKISVNSSGTQANGNSEFYFDISADGRYVAFSSVASNLVSGDTNGVIDVFVRDRKLGTTTLISKDSSGNFGDGASKDVSLSCDGSLVAFKSAATNLVSGDTNGKIDTFVFDRVNNSMKNITLNGNDDSSSNDQTDISCDGSKVLFTTNATNLVTPNLSVTSFTYVYSYEIFSEEIEVVSLADNESEPNDNWNVRPTVSFDGRFVTFNSNASNLVSSDSNSKADIFIRDTLLDTTEIISKRDSSNQTTVDSLYPSISPNGLFVVYISGDTGLVGSDTNSAIDVFMSKTGADYFDY